MHRQSHGNDNATLFAIAEVLGSDAIRVAINAHGQGCDVTVFVNEPKKNKDGSIDIYFAPEPPKGWEKNHVQTISGRGWFPYMRMYGATEKAFNDAYKFPTVNKVKDFSEYIE